MDSLKNLLITDSEEVRPNWGTSAEYWLCVLGTFSWSDGDNSIIFKATPLDLEVYGDFHFLFLKTGNNIYFSIPKTNIRGGAFLIPYLICFVCVAIPLFYWEAAIGQMIQKVIMELMILKTSELIRDLCLLLGRFLHGFGVWDMQASQFLFLCPYFITSCWHILGFT